MAVIAIGATDVDRTIAAGSVRLFAANEIVVVSKAVDVPPIVDDISIHIAFAGSFASLLASLFIGAFAGSFASSFAGSFAGLFVGISVGSSAGPFASFAGSFAAPGCSITALVAESIVIAIVHHSAKGKS